MIIDHGLITMGVSLTPFFILGVCGFLIARKIHTVSLCKKCGDNNWVIENIINRKDNNIVYKLVFKCVNCGHIRAEYKTVEKHHEDEEE